ncbi:MULTISPECIES: AfsR/SARP family transcriptional regulator [Pseudofrankia]|uniref:AfsR/SARP family transcriptional regulator n=1 Tax=Pseudofrankia TaxID=2994363 RepID=UPI000234CA41|nr:MULTISPECIES: BTAD domain-containing putative transcriptional regulator [Pseudofrankia]OHV41507.1 hypothetical protein BCD49_00670 [Pseudofrankia sp. EUN1h]
MGTLHIRLIGQPVIERGGRTVLPPRGRRAWALLGYLLLAERPPGRRHLADLLFGTAEDPLGALRWSLSELRRALGQSDAFQGNPISTQLTGRVSVDVDLLAAEPADPAVLLELGGELLENVELQDRPAFQAWLLAERHRVVARHEALLRSVASARLADGLGEEAVRYASAAVARNPLVEGNHELLVRGLVAIGSHAAARRQADACEALLRRELGSEPSPALRAALAPAVVAPAVSLALPRGSHRTAAVSLLRAGQAAASAGAVATGLGHLRQAAAEAALGRDRALRAQVLTALGTALHRADKAVAALREAAELAEVSGDRSTASAAYRELGLIDVRAGLNASARTWLASARELAETDAERAAVLGLLGWAATELADYRAAFACLDESLELARSAGDSRQQAWTCAYLGRVHLLRADGAEAAATLARSLELVREQRWIPFLPFPLALRAEVDLRAGEVDRAADGFEQAWLTASQTGDPCWQELAARGLGLVFAGVGDEAAARAWFHQAARLHQPRDSSLWVHGLALNATIADALLRCDEPRAARLTHELAELARGAGMRELLAYAHLHRYRLGDSAALPEARRLAAEIDNPALTAQLTTAA